MQLKFFREKIHIEQRVVQILANQIQRFLNGILFRFICSPGKCQKLTEQSKHGPENQWRGITDLMPYFFKFSCFFELLPRIERSS